MDGQDEVDQAILLCGTSPSGTLSGTKAQAADNDWTCVARHSDRFINDLTELQLPPDLCREARRKEIDYLKSNKRLKRIKQMR